MLKTDKLRRASKICWFIGAVMTINFIRNILAISVRDPTLSWLIAIPLSFGVQYVLTLMESALFDGSLPPPWRINWSEGGFIPWLAVGAFSCLLVDMGLNLGGVGLFMMKFEQATANGVFNIDTALMQIVKVILTILFALLFAVGSELLEAYANHLDGNSPRIISMSKMVHAPQEQRQPSSQTKQQLLAAMMQHKQEAVVDNVIDVVTKPAQARTIDSKGRVI